MCTLRLNASLHFPPLWFDGCWNKPSRRQLMTLAVKGNWLAGIILLQVTCWWSWGRRRWSNLQPESVHLSYRVMWPVMQLLTKILFIFNWTEVKQWPQVWFPMLFDFFFFQILMKKLKTLQVISFSPLPTDIIVYSLHSSLKLFYLLLQKYCNVGRCTENYMIFSSVVFGEKKWLEWLAWKMKITMTGKKKIATKTILNSINIKSKETTVMAMTLWGFLPRCWSMLLVVSNDNRCHPLVQRSSQWS